MPLHRLLRSLPARGDPCAGESQREHENSIEHNFAIIISKWTKRVTAPFWRRTLRARYTRAAGARSSSAVGSEIGCSSRPSRLNVGLDATQASTTSAWKSSIWRCLAFAPTTCLPSSRHSARSSRSGRVSPSTRSATSTSGCRAANPRPPPGTKAFSSKAIRR